MNKFFIILILFSSCYTETKKPNYKFMNSIKQQSFLDSSLQTKIKLIPKEFNFGNIKNGDSLHGYFYIKNVGKRNFNIVSIKSNCDCIKTDYNETAFIKPDDSIKIEYRMNIAHRKGLFSNTIIAIGNCSNGNATYLFEGNIY